MMTLDGEGSTQTAGRTQRSNRVNRRGGSCLLDLPDDVLFIILSHCHLQGLGRLSCVCRRLAHFIMQDCVWLSLCRSLTLVNDPRRRSFERVIVKEQCRFAINWSRGHFQDMHLIHHGVKQLPWLQLDRNYMWISYKNLIRCYKQKNDGSLRELPQKTLRHHRDDVGRFVAKQHMVISGSRDRSICAFSSVTGEVLAHLENCHTEDIQAVDFHQDLVVSGSRDATVKLWKLNGLGTEEAHQCTLMVNDRVWSLAMSPTGRYFVTGTAGINHIPPLRIWDVEGGQLVAVLGSHYKYGAGVLDIQYETPDMLLSCGYDTFTRLWDLRKSHSHCVLMWEEPFDSTLYCVKSDGHYTVMTGTARHGMVRLWDKRHPEPVQMYYTGRTSSPVYSIAFDMSHLYAALDKGINMLDFSRHG